MKKYCMKSMFLLAFGMFSMSSLFYVPAVYGQESASSDDNKPLILLTPSKQAVISARIDAKIAKYLVQENDMVESGQLVVSLDKEPFELQEKIYESRLSETKVKKAHHDREHDRFLKLYEKKVVPATRYETERLKRDQVYEQFENLTSALETVRLDLKYCDIHAPFKGRLVKRIARGHEFLEVGDPIFKIICDNPLHVIVNFRSGDLHKVSKGQFLKVKLNNTAKSRFVKIINVSAEINPESETFQVTAVLPNDNYKFRPGMFGVCLGVKSRAKED